MGRDLVTRAETFSHLPSGEGKGDLDIEFNPVANNSINGAYVN